MSDSNEASKPSMWRAGRSGLVTAAIFVTAMLLILALEGRLPELYERLGGSNGEEHGTGSRTMAPAAALQGVAASSSYFRLPAPASPERIQELERAMLASRAKITALGAELEERALALSQREHIADAHQRRLDQIEQELIERAGDLELTAAELAREQRAFRAAGEKAHRRLARTLAEMSPAKAAHALMAHANDETLASLWVELPADIQAAIAEELSDEESTRLWPAVLRVERARRARSEGSER